MNYKIKRLGNSDLNDLRNLLAVFSQIFENKETAAEDLPDDSYLRSQLERSDVYIVVALQEEKVIGGVTGFELPLLSKKGKEMYLYDLGVDANYRRQGIARALINELKVHAKNNRLSLAFVEAEAADGEAVHFYRSLGAEELKVSHFNIQID